MNDPKTQPNVQSRESIVMTTDSQSNPKNPEDLLSPKACWAIKERFGSMWRQAWIAWQQPSGTWMVTQVKHLTADSGLPENSGDMFCFKTLKRPTESDLMEMMMHPCSRPSPTITTEQAKGLMATIPGSRIVKAKP